MTTKTKGLRPFRIKQSITNRDQESLKVYLKELNCEKTKPLSREQELEYFELYKNGSGQEVEFALEKIITSNLRFAVSVAKEFEQQEATAKLPDLICVANMGLLTAAKRFDHTKGNKFISYAVWWIRQHLLEYIKNKSKVIHLPNNAKAVQSKAEKFIELFYNENGYHPSKDQIADGLGCSKEMLKLIDKSAYVKSLDAPLSCSDDYKDTSLYSVTASRSKPIDQNIGNELQGVINRMLNVVLTEREVFILNQYFGLNDNVARSRSSIGKDLNLTTERVRQLRDTALRKLREYIIKNDLSIVEYL